MDLRSCAMGSGNVHWVPRYSAGSVIFGGLKKRPYFGGSLCGPYHATARGISRTPMKDSGPYLVGMEDTCGPPIVCDGVRKRSLGSEIFGRLGHFRGSEKTTRFWVCPCWTSGYARILWTISGYNSMGPTKRNRHPFVCNRVPNFLSCSRICLAGCRFLSNPNT